MNRGSNVALVAWRVSTLGLAQFVGLRSSGPFGVEGGLCSKSPFRTPGIHPNKFQFKTKHVLQRTIFKLALEQVFVFDVLWLSP